MDKSCEKYLITKDNSIRKVLELFQDISNTNQPTGIAVVVDNDRKVLGSITEGDIRRALLDGATLDTGITNIFVENPICFDSDHSYKDILDELPSRLRNRNRKSSKYLSNIIITNKEGELEKILGYHELWEQRVATHRHIVIIGLGYVGLTLALVLLEQGFLVTGVESDESKVNCLKNAESYIHEKGIEELLKSHVGKNFIITTEAPDEGDVFVISVGTPIAYNENNSKHEPILNYIKDTAKTVGEKLNSGNLVILRSTVPTGLTRDFVLPELEKSSGLKCGKDFHLAFAPERTAEGNALKELRELPQVIGGINSESIEAAAALFRELTSTIIRVSSLEAAEMTKLVNNSYRDIVFSYSNYICQIASIYNIDIYEVINAANQGYPRNRVPLPSPGVGGPCLTKDPHIFSKSCSNDILFSGMTLFDHGRLINESMHGFISKKIIDRLKDLGKNISECKIAIFGLAFKGNPETGDVRNSSGVEVHNAMAKETNYIYGHDPVATAQDIEEVGIVSSSFENACSDADVLMFMNNHAFYVQINIIEALQNMNDNPIIFDAWNLFRADDIISSRPSMYINMSKVCSSL